MPATCTCAASLAERGYFPIVWGGRACAELLVSPSTRRRCVEIAEA